MSGEEEERDTDLATRRGSSMRRSVLGGFDSIFEDFRRDFDNMMNLWFPRSRPITSLMRARYPAIDVVDEGESYVVRADLPGMSKDQVEVNLTGEGIEISGREERSVTEEGENYLLKERSAEAFSRRLAFPETVLPNEAEAKMRDGILTVSIPKKEPTPKEGVIKLDIE